MKNKIIIGIVAAALFTGCQSKTQQKPIAKAQKTQAESLNHDFLIQAVLWQQHSGEYRALAYQAYSTAKFRLNQILKNKPDHKKPLAIVTDIDETILNNSPYSGMQIKKNEDYTPKTWKDWVDLETAKAIPGAVSFFNYAKSKNVAVFYITGRAEKSEKETIDNLKKDGFPFSDAQHLMLWKKTEKGKQSRRDSVRKNYDIVMLLGDNLLDFSNIFNVTTSKNRNAVVDSAKALFGKKFIVLPNPMYGSWMSNGILNGKHGLTDAQKDSIRKSKLIGF